MNSETWQQLLSLESRDIVSDWFFKLHGRALNAQRAGEIIAAARQGREFFRTASLSSNVVRPLLTYYGVRSLSLAITLLFKRQGGLETLNNGHGLRTVGWSEKLSGNIHERLSEITKLEVVSCAGLFGDLISSIGNGNCFHVRSSRVDWLLPYEAPKSDLRISLFDLLCRIPDLKNDLRSVKGASCLCAGVSEMSYNKVSGFSARVNAREFSNFVNFYSGDGYSLDRQSDTIDMSCNPAQFAQKKPQFLHAYVQKTFGWKPMLFVVAPFSATDRYCQLSITFLAAYFLGMLVRYYPNVWVAISSGQKGDSIWPILNRMQNYAEICFPELVMEFISYRLDDSNRQ